jgi:hypothetical protein
MTEMSAAWRALDQKYGMIPGYVFEFTSTRSEFSGISISQVGGDTFSMLVKDGLMLVQRDFAISSPLSSWTLKLPSHLLVRWILSCGGSA